MELPAEPASNNLTLSFGKILCQLPHPVWSHILRRTVTTGLTLYPNPLDSNTMKTLLEVRQSALEQPDKAGCGSAVIEWVEEQDKERCTPTSKGYI